MATEFQFLKLINLTNMFISQSKKGDRQILQTLNLAHSLKENSIIASLKTVQISGKIHRTNTRRQLLWRERSNTSEKFQQSRRYIQKLYKFERVHNDIKVGFVQNLSNKICRRVAVYFISWLKSRYIKHSYAPVAAKRLFVQWNRNPEDHITIVL